MDEIKEIVLNRNKERKLLTKADLLKICEIIKNINHFDDLSFYFEKVYSKDKNRGGCYGNNEMIFYIQGMERLLEEDYKLITNLNRFKCPDIDIYNYIYLTIIFHEFAHVRQDRIVENGFNHYDKKLFIMSELYLNKDNEFYHKNYRMIPSEVDAFNRGYINAYNVYRRFPKNFLTDNDRLNYSSFILDNMLNNYFVDGKKEIVTSPLENIYKKTTDVDISRLGVSLDAVKKIIDNKHDITLYRKLLIGLPISFDEFSYANLLSNMVLAGQDINFIKKLQRKM